MFGTYIKYTVSIITKNNPQWKNVYQTDIRLFAEQKFKKYSAMINPEEARVSLSKMVMPRGYAFIRTEELKSVGSKNIKSK